MSSGHEQEGAYAVAVRIQVVLERAEREEFRRRAAEEGLSLSAWLREAGRERSRRHRTVLRSAEDLRAFFAAQAAKEPGVEPDWSEHMATIEQSRRPDAPLT